MVTALMMDLAALFHLPQLRAQQAISAGSNGTGWAVKAWITALLLAFDMACLLENDIAEIKFSCRHSIDTIKDYSGGCD
jgi:hypothetical protein